MENNKRDWFARFHPKRLSIKWKVFVPVAGIVLAAFLTYAYYGYKTLQDQFITQSGRSAQILATVIAQRVYPALIARNPSSARQVLSEISTLPSLQQVALLTPQGKPWVRVYRTSSSAPSPPFLPTLLDLARRQKGPAGRMGENWIYHSVQAVHNSEGDLVGFIQIDFSSVDTYRQLTRNSQQFGVITGVTLVLLALALIIVLHVLVSRPLAELMTAMKQVEQGDLTARAEIRSGDELEQLGQNFNRMVQEIEQKNRQLVQSEKLASIGLLAAGVAHEINNPIATISVSAERLLETETSEERRRFLQIILKESERIGQIINKLLGFERGGRVAFSPCHLERILQQSLEDFASIAEQNRVQVETDFQIEGAVLNGQCDQLRQAFGNIIDNALKAMPQGGQLRIRAYREDQEVVIEFMDTGPGIPQEYLDRIFDPFFTTREVGEGFGLGLAVCYEVVKRHGGNISVQSDAGGTTFTLRLPLLGENQEKEDALRKRVPYLTRGRRPKPS